MSTRTRTRQERITFIADADVCTRFKDFLKKHDIKPLGDVFEFFMLQVLKDPSASYTQTEVTELIEKFTNKKQKERKK